MQPSLDKTFLALGDPARLAVIRLLRKKPRRSSDIASALSLSPQPFARLRSWLDEVEAFWGDQLGSFKAHVESKYAASRRS